MKKTVMAVFLTCSLSVSAESAGDLLQTKLNAIHSMSAHFSQVVKAKQRVVSRSSGSMALERPGRFRWQTQSPMSQLMIADGRRMWVYDADLEQVTVKPQGRGMGGTAALFLSGANRNINRDFNVKQSGAGRFDLQSKSPKANFQRVQLTFSNNVLTGLVLYDQLGQVTSVHLSNARLNPHLNAGLFHFKPPKGVDVVQQ